jgi:DNA repair photolyase
MSEQAEHWLHGMRHLVQEYAEAKAQRVYLEHFRKSKKAMLMAEAQAKDPDLYKSSASQETYAYRHDEYVELLEGLKVATETEEFRRWQLKSREMRFEEWRTNQATERQERKGYGA